MGRLDRPDRGLPTLAIARASGGVTVTWAGGTLESAGSVTAPWQPANLGPSPAAVAADAPARWFRVRR